MSRYKPLKERSASDRIELENIIQNPLSDSNLVQRAKAIQRFLEGEKGDAIAKALKVRPNTVSDWRKKYEENGIEGLYTKAPKGKRGSETREKVLKMLDSTPPEAGWSTRTLADAAGTSLDTVRRALKDEHMTVSKSYIWDKEIKRSSTIACVEAIGLYMSKEEAGFILKIASQLNRESSGFVTTCNRNLANVLEQMDHAENGISLEDAILASVQEMKEVSRGNKEAFQDFFAKICKENDSRMIDGMHSEKGKDLYYVFYWCANDKGIKPILQRTGIVVDMTESIDEWITKIKPWIIINSYLLNKDSHKKANSLMNSIALYMERTTVLVEPFEWRTTFAAV